MVPQEERMSALLTFPFGSFLMLRLEYVLLTGNELEAKILRLIEKRMDDERRRRYQAQMNKLPSGTKESSTVLDIPKNVWVPISHALFLYDLYGLVQSENTLKRALSSLLKKELILTRKGQGRYAPTEYQLNLEKIEEEFAAMSAQCRAGYQPVTPSSPDTQEAMPEDQAMIPSEYHVEIPSPTSRGSTLDPLRVSANDPNRRETEKNHSRKIGEAVDSASEPQAAAPPHATGCPPLAHSPSGTPLDAEAIVRLIESKRGLPYDPPSRSQQLHAAQQLLALPVSLTIDRLERVYDECYDPWWQQHFGDLHVTHLVEREKPHGEPRILRLLKRVQAKRDRPQNIVGLSSSDPGVYASPASPLHVGISGLPIIHAPAQPMTVIASKRSRPRPVGRMIS